jgi:hypothetical protein
MGLTMYTEQALADLVQVRVGLRDAATRLPDDYDSRFQHWDARASVRQKPPRILRPVDSGMVYFPPELYPIVSHPLVRARGAEVVDRLLVDRLYSYLQFTTELEEIAVIPIATSISRGRAGLDLPEGMRGDAFKIVTDEAWHAQFSYEMIRQVEHETAIPWQEAGLPAFITRLDAIRRRLPEHLRGTEGLLFSVVSETLISSILADVPRDHRLPQAVRELIRDHAEDEGRHHAYFRSVLHRFWPALDPSAREALGPFLPEVILAFLEPDYRTVAVSLRRLGFPASQTEQIIMETWPAEKVAADASAAARSVLRYFGEVGVMDVPRTSHAFTAAGLIL